MLDATTLYDPDGQPSADVIALHDRCGVYTRPAMVEQILDEIGWTADIDLTAQRLLEPAAGDGAFVLEAARRLLSSFETKAVELTPAALSPRIRAFELHEGEAEKGRTKLIGLLLSAGMPAEYAVVVAGEWLSTEDFLLSALEEGRFTHTAGNPPYSRWSKIPRALRIQYEAALPKHIAKGDLFLPFLDRGIAALAPGGKLGFLCSNRWQYMAFAEGFRTERLPQVRLLLNEEAEADQVYERSVDIYPSVLVFERRGEPTSSPSTRRPGKTLKEAGFDIRVGPALGCTEAYVVSADCRDEIELELLAPWVSASDVQDGEIKASGKHVICLYDDDGRLRDLREFPRAHRWLLRFKGQLEKRSVVAVHKAPWYRPIDRVYAAAWATPKLMIPELARVPRLAIDRSGAVPSHGVYAIMAGTPDADLDALAVRLSNGGLAQALEGTAPKVKGGYVRCYKRFLEAIMI